MHVHFIHDRLSLCTDIDGDTDMDISIDKDPDITYGYNLFQALFFAVVFPGVLLWSVCLVWCWCVSGECLPGASWVWLSWHVSI